MDEQTTNTNESLLYELALRLATHPGDPRVNDSQLLVGQLPPNLSIEIPIPEGSRLLGSLLRSQENIDIVLDCALSPDKVMQFYKERMAAAGWNELDTMRPHHGGFVHSSFPLLLNRAVYCRGSQGPAFTITANAGKNSRTDVRIDLDGSSESSPCSQPNRRHERMMHRRRMDLIPPLLAPQGGRQQGGAGGGSGDSWYSSATLEIEAGLPTLAIHYNGQLTGGGWTLSGEGQAGPLVWSTWTFQDEDKEPWSGLFFILKTPGKERTHVLAIHIELDKKDKEGHGMRLVQGGGWYSSTSSLG